MAKYYISHYIFSAIITIICIMISFLYNLQNICLYLFLCREKEREGGRDFYVAQK